MKNNVSIVQSRLDSFGAFLSVLCAIHCTLLPGLVAALPILAIDSIVSEPVHDGLLIGSILLALGACTWGFRRHKKGHLIVLLSLGIILIGTSFVVESSYHAIMAAIGSLFLAMAHIVNHILCRSCVKCQK